MRTAKQIAAAVLTAALLGTSAAQASVSFDMIPVDNSALLTGYTTYDLQVTTDLDWTSAAMLLELTDGSIYQHAQGLDGVPNPAIIPYLYPQYPEMVFDTYVIGSIAGGGGDIGRRDTQLAFDTQGLDVAWFNTTKTDTGTTTIGRLTLADDADGSLTILLKAGGAEDAQYTVTIEAGTAQTPMPIVEESSLLSGAGWESELSLVSPGMPGDGDTRSITPIKVPYSDKDKRIDGWWEFRPTGEPVAATSSESTTPEPGTLALIGACLAPAMLRRRQSRRGTPNNFG